MNESRYPIAESAASPLFSVSLKIEPKDCCVGVSPGAWPGPLAKLARERFGKFLKPEELALMDEDMAFVESRGGRLRGYKLANGDEPVVDFRVVRK